MTGRSRTIWPPRKMQRIETLIGMSVIDYLVEGFAITGSMTRTAKWLVEDAAEVGVAFETVKDWWKAACQRDPTLEGRAADARREWARNEALALRAEAIERKGLLREISQVRAALNGRHCPVDGAPVGFDRTQGLTCSPRCHQLWVNTRYHISEDHRANHQKLLAARVLRKPEDYLPAAVPYARRVLAGEPTADHGRWTTSPKKTAELIEVVERRKAAKQHWGDLAVDLPEIRALGNLHNQRKRPA